MIDITASDNVAVALIIMNFLAFATFGIDKSQAENGRWRIQESTLLLLALLGGVLGAYAGRALFRHKTRKQPFSGQLFAVVIFQAILLAAIAGWTLEN